MDLFIMIKRKNLTMFLEVKQTTPVSELKKMIQGILKVAPEKQRLYFHEMQLKDDETLGELGLEKNTAGAHCPACFGLAVGYEELQITPLSSPPEFQDAMKPQEQTPETVCT